MEDITSLPCSFLPPPYEIRILPPGGGSWPEFSTLHKGMLGDAECIWKALLPSSPHCTVAAAKRIRARRGSGSFFSFFFFCPPSALWQGPTRGSCQVAWSECRLPAVDSGTPEADRPSLAALHPFKGWHVPLSRICLSLSRSNCVAGLRNPDSEGPVVKL